MKRVRPAPMGGLPLPAADGAHRDHGGRELREPWDKKVHPYGFRLGVTKTWRSRWYAKQEYAQTAAGGPALKDALRKR